MHSSNFIHSTYPVFAQSSVAFQCNECACVDIVHPGHVTHLRGKGHPFDRANQCAEVEPWKHCQSSKYFLIWFHGKISISNLVTVVCFVFLTFCFKEEYTVTRFTII